MASLKNPHLQPQGCAPGCSFGGLLLIPHTPRTPSPRPQTRWMGDEAALAFSRKIYGAAGEGLSWPFAVQNSP